MRKIESRKELIALADELGVRKDWHEPDEQGVEVVVKGNVFDNAGFWPRGVYYAPGAEFDGTEKYAVIKQNGKPIAAVNLATLFAMACSNG